MVTDTDECETITCKNGGLCKVIIEHYFSVFLELVFSSVTVRSHNLSIYLAGWLFRRFFLKKKVLLDFEFRFELGLELVKKDNRKQNFCDKLTFFCPCFYQLPVIV